MCRGDARHREWRWCAPEGEWRAARVQAGRADWQKAAASGKGAAAVGDAGAAGGAVPEGCGSGQAVLRRPRPGGCSRCSADCAILVARAAGVHGGGRGRFMSGAPVSVTGCAPMPPSIGRHCGQFVLRAARRPGQAVQSLRCNAGRPLRSARTAGCSTARRGRSGCRSGPMRPWCRRPGAHGVRPRPGCGCRRWCGSAAASRMPGRCSPDR